MKNLIQYVIRNRVNGLYAKPNCTYYWYSYCFQNKSLQILVHDHFKNNLPFNWQSDGWGNPNTNYIKTYDSQRSAYLAMRCVVCKMNKRYNRLIPGNYGQIASPALIATVPDKKEWLKEILLNTEIIPVSMVLGQAEDWKNHLPKSLRKLLP